MRIWAEGQHARRLTLGLLLGPAVVLGVCLPAWANSGTAMLWAGVVHLVFGNFFIAVAEWIVLQWMCPEARRRRALFWMIVANYASAWAGAWLLPQINDGVLSAGGLAELSQVRWNLVVLLAAMVWVTLAIEAPFYWLAARRPRAAWRFGKPLLAAHVLSYGLLAAWYGLAFEPRLIWGTEVVPISTIGPRSHGGWVYYISAGDRWRRVRLDGSRDEAVNAPETTIDERALASILLIECSPNGRFRLVARADDGSLEYRAKRRAGNDARDTLLIDELAGTPARFAPVSGSIYFGAIWDSRMANFSPAITPHMQVDRGADWEPRLGTDYRRLIYEHPTRDWLTYAYDLPWERRRFRVCTLVDPHCVVVELMSIGIFVLDMDHDRIAKLADGQMPIVVIDP